MRNVLKIFLILIITLSAQEKKDVIYNDGPYIHYLNDSTIVCMLHHYKNKEIKFTKKVMHIKEFAEFSKTLPLPELEYYLQKPKVEQVDYKASKILAVGDLHGDFDGFTALLINNKIIDEKLNWNFGNGHLILPGDLPDRGAKVTECFWLIRKLEKQAQKAGGKVHYLLGNHDFLIMQGDLRYPHEKYNLIHKHRYDELYSRKTEIGKWLRTKNVIEKINGIVFVHGGISQKLLDTKLPLKEINKLSRELIDTHFTYAIEDEKKGELLELLLRGNGPVWYRGYFNDSTLVQKDFDNILTELQAEKIVVGHTKQSGIMTKFDGKLIGIDTFDYETGKKESIQALLIENKKYYIIKIDGSKTELNN